MSAKQTTESGHYQTKSTGDEDPFETMMKKTGCLQLHYKVQDCMFEHRDWRQCKQEVADFRTCFEEFKRKESQSRP
jgi:hypothetical protein